MIVTCGTLILGALASKTVFRGAIEDGVLTHFPPGSDGSPGDPYGPGLAKANYLENKVAGHPRIVVGPTLLSYLDATMNDPDRRPVAEANRAMAVDCRRCLTKDVDGHCIVDYLNDHFANLGGDPAAFRHLRDQAYLFIRAELDRFQRAGDKKLADRYSQLDRYFQFRGATP